MIRHSNQASLNGKLKESNTMSQRNISGLQRKGRIVFGLGLGILLMFTILDSTSLVSGTQAAEASTDTAFGQMELE